MSTGVEVSSSAANSYGIGIGGLAGLGYKVLAAGSGRFFSFIPLANDFDYYTFSCNYNYRDIAYANGHIYINKDGFICKYSESPYLCKQTFYVPDMDIYGIAFDGTYFWCSALNRKTGKSHMLKLQLQ